MTRNRFPKAVPKAGSTLRTGTAEPPLTLTDVSLRQGGVDSEVAGSAGTASVPEFGNRLKESQ